MLGHFKVENTAFEGYDQPYAYLLSKEGDRVILTTTKASSLTKPLAKDSKTDVRGGYIEHNNIIGKSARDVVQTHNARASFRITQPTLEEYVSLTPRLVTPIYAPDASLIVSLLDIHTPPPNEKPNEEPLEILEAGTGHGSLTLHLARAINGANTYPPPIPEATQRTILDTDGHTPNAPERTEVEETKQKDWDAWRAKRNAILHTVEISPKVSSHAEKVVRGFRRGMYTGSVDFHVSSAEKWIQHQIETRTAKLPPSEELKPFLSYAILDMPSVETRIPEVARVLKPDGVLAVFVPSITQIGDCFQMIRDQKLPFIFTKAVELGTGISGGRLWDIRAAVVRASVKPTASQDETEASSTKEDEESIDSSLDESDSTLANEDQTTMHSKESAEPEEPQAVKHVMVCRPKVGERVVGGGFVGIWRMGRV
ncbi:tRNA (adenine-N(1)-)-methyltransferase [Arthroderma uncinatum]|uniref:tRNA (adenine-N(1)-)-methyltransferase n=1 Tax=Arthroderma uncinatum TaxID=74035 RepID=UPI00144A9405|nr:tRNA (adenine-N(1)-)-methyltransferase [Arthroderma uncinatum]KAF3491835.1 tRNA (adenine-N(1)-)-methyltransferase [Arthroderma uncinatum]